MPFWQRFLLAERSPLLRYGVALLLTCALVALAYLVSRLEGTPLPSLVIVSVVLSAVYGGMGPALIAAVIAAVGVDYFIIEPVGEVFGSYASLIRMVTYAFTAVVIASIVGALRDAYRHLHAQYGQVERAKRARETVLAIVSHDLRSPLSAVLVGMEYIKRVLAEGKPVDSLVVALNAIHRSADSMRRLVDDLLDAARIESGRFTVERVRQSLVPILTDAAASARLAADAKGIRIELQAPQGAYFAHCDRQRLTQVLTNLLGNAVKFSQDGARVDLRLSDEGEWLRIDVQDWGPGIHERDLPHVFTRYWQAEDTAHLGTGLGLFIAKTIIESHGGRIAVESNVGQGTTFRVYLRREDAVDLASREGTAAV